MLKNLLALLAGVLTLVVGIMFSLVLFALLAVLALSLGGYFWWKTRKLRQTMREHPPGGRVIEGEVVVVDESAAPAKDARPGEPPGR